MSKSKRRTLLIIGIMLIISLVIGISYAYWKKTVVQTNQNSITSTCFNISFKEDTESINLDKIYPITDEEGKSLSPYTFTITNECDRYTSFQINLEILDTTTLNDKYIKVALNESTPEILTNKEVVEKTLEDAVTSYKLETGYLDSNESKTYNLRLWMDESTPALEETMNKLFSSKITVIASYVEEIPTFSDIIKECNKENNAANCFIENGAKNETELAFDNTVDNNLRYIGANPNNYVLFNNELWRIIGAMNNIDDGTGKKETRLKIIRGESTENYAWDVENSNDWTKASLQEYLNGDYLNNIQSGFQSMIGNVKWNLGGSSTYDDVTASVFYERERGTQVYGDIPTEWIGKVGLMYVSDYGYATKGSVTINRDECLSKKISEWHYLDISDCFNNDWLYDNNVKFTLTHYSADSYNVILVSGKLGLGIDNALNTYNFFTPVIYLVADTKISGGEGTESNPYTLSL